MSGAGLEIKQSVQSKKYLCNATCDTFIPILNTIADIGVAAPGMELTFR